MITLIFFPEPTVHTALGLVCMGIEAWVLWWSLCGRPA